MGSNIIHGWTDERVDLLKKLWHAGRSASQIARQLRGVTRNAVIGKVNRLSLGGREAPYQPGRPVAKAARPLRASQPPVLKIAGRGSVFEEAEPQAPRVELRPEAFAPLPGIQPIPFIERNWSRCAWPVGGEGAEMLCCGAQRDGEGPYCGAHRQRATQAVRPGSPRTASELARSLRRYVA